MTRKHVDSNGKLSTCYAQSSATCPFDDDEHAVTDNPEKGKQFAESVNEKRALTEQGKKIPQRVIDNIDKNSGRSANIAATGQQKYSLKQKMWEVRRENIDVSTFSEKDVYEHINTLATEKPIAPGAPLN